MNNALQGCNEIHIIETRKIMIEQFYNHDHLKLKTSFDKVVAFYWSL